jgi:hypothetical protein
MIALFATLFIWCALFDTYLTRRRAKKFGGLAAIELNPLSLWLAQHLGDTRAIILTNFVPRFTIFALLLAAHLFTVFVFMTGISTGFFLNQLTSLSLEREIDRLTKS